MKPLSQAESIAAARRALEKFGKAAREEILKAHDQALSRKAKARLLQTLQALDTLIRAGDQPARY